MQLGITIITDGWTDGQNSEPTLPQSNFYADVIYLWFSTNSVMKLRALPLAQKSCLHPLCWMTNLLKVKYKAYTELGGYTIEVFFLFFHPKWNANVPSEKTKF